jgi:hypothetical protein
MIARKRGSKVLIFSGLDLAISTNNTDKAMDIFTAIEVVATPFFWELMPMITNSEINNTPHINA